MDRRTTEWRRVVAFGLCLLSTLAVAWTCSNTWNWLQAEQRSKAPTPPKAFCEQVQQLAYLSEGEFRRMDTRLDNLENLLSAIGRGQGRVLAHFKLELVPIFPIRLPEPPNFDAWEVLECPKSP